MIHTAIYRAVLEDIIRWRGNIAPRSLRVGSSPRQLDSMLDFVHDRKFTRKYRHIQQLVDL